MTDTLALPFDVPERELPERISFKGATYVREHDEARLRDLRRLGWTVDRRRRGNPKAGLHEYRVLSR
jgi:hypothetical protein